MLQFPIMARILAPLDPIIRLYFGFPFARWVHYAGLHCCCCCLQEAYHAELT